MKYGHLAIIPARSGSKGLKDKNIKNLSGKPMIAYTIEAAIDSGIYDCIYVSTDSEKYAELARSYGASIQFIRPEYLSNDTSTTADVIEYTIDMFRKKGDFYRRFSILQPTSPLRKYKHILEANELFDDKKAVSVVSVCETEHSPLWSNTIDNDLSLKDFINIENNRNRQNLKKYYRVNGAIYIANTEKFLENKNFYGENSFAYIMDRYSSVDVDDILDFRFAEFLLEKFEK